VSSDGYPENMLDPLKIFSGNLIYLGSELNLSIKPAGNFNYYYNVDCDAGTLSTYESQIYWRNAPSNWKERGWNCWANKKGNYGWNEWRKGKKLDTYKYPKCINISIIEDTKYTIKDIKDLSNKCGWYYKNLIKGGSKDIHNIHTLIKADNEVYNNLYVIPYENLPLHVTSTNAHETLMWRLNYGK